MKPNFIIYVNISLQKVKHHAMKMSGEVEVQLHSFLSWALDDEWSTSRSGRFPPYSRAAGAYWTDISVGRVQRRLRNAWKP
jgi:hypothetical protein